MMPEQITEEMKIHEEWFVEAKTITTETLPAFIRKLTENYNHDYGTIVHAITAAAIAAATAVNKSDVGGITGFQAGCVLWGFISKWMHYEDTPLKLVNYEHMLYPQYYHDFDKTISPETWEWLREKAGEFLQKERDFLHPDVKAHWEAIVMGQVPFGYRIDKKDK